MPPVAVDQVSVLAIDPSSPFTGGAILGDRIRMQDHATDPSVYIRSMATRGHLGGLALAVPEAVRALGAAGMPIVLVETVGVGQMEVEVASAADTTVVVVTPGWGDSMQANKAGLLEVADLFVINKADRPGVGEARRDLQQMLDLSGHLEWRPPIVETVAATGAGVEDLWSEVATHRRYLIDRDLLEHAPCGPPRARAASDSAGRAHRARGRRGHGARVRRGDDRGACRAARSVRCGGPGVGRRRAGPERSLSALPSGTVRTWLMSGVPRTNGTTRTRRRHLGCSSPPIAATDGVAVVRMDRPKANALSLELLDQLRVAAEALTADPPGAVVVWGGERIFAAGADINELANSTPGTVADRFHAALRALADVPRATIAAINGFALGGGLELALACDFRVCSDEARLGLPEVLLGIIPGGGGTQRLPRLIGTSRAKDLIMTGRQVRADEALAMGLVNRVVPTDQVLDQALLWAAELARGAVVAQSLGKAAVDLGMEASLEEALHVERGRFVAAFRTEDAARGITSFLEQGPGKASFVGR